MIPTFFSSFQHIYNFCSFLGSIFLIAWSLVVFLYHVSFALFTHSLRREACQRRERKKKGLESKPVHDGPPPHTIIILTPPLLLISYPFLITLLFTTKKSKFTNFRIERYLMTNIPDHEPHLIITKYYLTSNLLLHVLCIVVVCPWEERRSERQNGVYLLPVPLL